MFIRLFHVCQLANTHHRALETYTYTYTSGRRNEIVHTTAVYIDDNNDQHNNNKI